MMRQELFKKCHKMEGFARLTLLPPMLLLRINEGVENAKNRLYK